MSRPQIGGVFQDRYMIVSQLGAGGMGVVYRAKQLDADREVAIKLLHADSLDDESTARFYREFKLLSKLSHPNIVTVYGVALDSENRPYAISEFVEGRTLRGLINEQERLAWEQATSIVVQLCDALQYIHDAGIIHRDLKPENIMLVDRPHPLFVKVLDFGIARLIDAGQSTSQKLTWTGQLLGSPQYMSPEQVEGKSDARSDLYALACIFFEMLAGEPLFNADNAVGLVFKQKSEDPTERIVALQKFAPYKLRSILSKALSKNPDNRFQTAAELAAELKDVQANPGSFDEGAGRRKSSKSTVIIATAVGALLFFVLVIVGSSYWLKPPKENISRQKGLDVRSAAQLKDLLAKARAENNTNKKRDLLHEFENASRTMSNTQLHLEGLDFLCNVSDHEEQSEILQSMDGILRNSGNRLSKNSKDYWTLRILLRTARNLVELKQYNKAFALVGDREKLIQQLDPSGESGIAALTVQIRSSAALKDTNSLDREFREFKQALHKYIGSPGSVVAEFFVFLIHSDLKLKRSDGVLNEHLKFFVELLEKVESRDSLISFGNDSMQILQDLSDFEKPTMARRLLSKTCREFEKRFALVKADAAVSSIYCRFLALEKFDNPAVKKPHLLTDVQSLSVDQVSRDSVAMAAVPYWASAVYSFDGEAASLKYLDKLKASVESPPATFRCKNANPSTFIMEALKDCIANHIDLKRLELERFFITSAYQNDRKCQLETARILEYSISTFLAANKIEEANNLSWSLLNLWCQKKLVGSLSFSSVLRTTLRVCSHDAILAGKNGFLKLAQNLREHVSLLEYKLDYDEAEPLAECASKITFGLVDFGQYAEAVRTSDAMTEFLKEHRMLSENCELLLVESKSETFRLPEAKTHVGELKSLASNLVKRADTLSYSSRCQLLFRGAVRNIFDRLAALKMRADAEEFYRGLNHVLDKRMPDQYHLRKSLIECYVESFDQHLEEIKEPEKVAAAYNAALKGYYAHDKSAANDDISFAVAKVARMLIHEKKNEEGLAFLREVRNYMERANAFGESNKLDWLDFYMDASRRVAALDEARACGKELVELSKTASNELIRAGADFVLGSVTNKRVELAEERLRRACDLYDTTPGETRFDRRYLSYFFLAKLYYKLGEPDKEAETFLRALKTQQRFDQMHAYRVEYIAAAMADQYEATNRPAKARLASQHSKDRAYLESMLRTR